MNFPRDLRYTKTHEWARREGLVITVGITDYAQQEISDIVFIELPKTGSQVQAGKAVAVVESVKAAFDIYSPVSGKVVRINTDLETNPAVVNQDCYGEGWLFELEASNPAEWDGLLAVQDYENHVKQENQH
ncbi:MAG: glycine cleavage system protein GcvH [Candidatus Omnitrophica bacterium]|nr:glycine cleavage system protein GcvH [Candidatus Omnitrophota bacterium]